MFATFHTSESKAHATPAQDNSAPFFQPKLIVNTPGDEYEKEADAVADQVMRMPSPLSRAGQGNAGGGQGNDNTPKGNFIQRKPIPRTPIQRKCAECEKEEQEGVQRKEKSGAGLVGSDRVIVRRKCAECEKENTAQRKENSVTPSMGGGRGEATGGQSAPPIVSDVLSSGGGRPLDGDTKGFMESRFGQDFSQVRVHTDSLAAESAAAIQAKAYTSGKDVVFGAGEYQPGTDSGKRLLAHELTHVGQQGKRSGNYNVQRFGSREHMKIGDNAVPNTMTNIENYGPIGFGEMIALAGDYFESIDEMSDLATNVHNGKDQISYARSLVNPKFKFPNPSEDVKSEVDRRYLRLASKNETHFSTGSAKGLSNKEQYVFYHKKALLLSLEMKKNPDESSQYDWKAVEGFAQHFLTDAFSAGHIRTPRGEIQRYWHARYPKFRNNLIELISCYMAAYINERDNVGYAKTVEGLKDEIIPEVKSLGGAALEVFSIEDIISLAMHDEDNKGLQVKNAAGHRWRDVGDGYLYPDKQPKQSSIDTAQMVEQASRVSFNEVEMAYDTEIQDTEKLIKTEDFEALRLIPEFDRDAHSDPVYIWKATSLSVIDSKIKDSILGGFKPSGEIYTKINEVDPEPDVAKKVKQKDIPYTNRELRVTFDIHVQEAWDCFKKRLLSDPWAILVNVAEGKICPPDDDSPCPMPTPDPNPYNKSKEPLPLPPDHGPTPY